VTDQVSFVTAPAKTQRKWKSSTGFDKVTVLAIALFVAFLAGWEWVLIPATGVSPALLPRPSQIAVSLFQGAAQGYLLPNTLITLQEVLIGFVVGSALGFILAAPVAEWRAVERILSPYVVALQAIPKVAIAPLFVVWFGYGLSSKVLIVGLITFFPVFINTVAGLRSVAHEQRELFMIYNATRWQRFRYLTLPNSGSFVVAGLNVGVTLSVIGAVVAEFVGAQEGLGSLIVRAGFAMDTAGVFAAVLCLTIIAAILSATVQVLGRKIVFWANDLRR